MNRTTRLLATLVAGALLSASLVACDGGGQASPEASEGEQELRELRIGTLPTEDALPLWAAEELGLYAEAGLPGVEIVTFQAAQERDAAFTAGEIDAFMGDIIAAAQLEAGGSEVTIGTIMLGSTPEEGRFGVVAAPGSAYNDIAGLSGVPVGTSSGTIQEYVLDGLMRQAGVPADQVVKEEVKKVPVRFDLLMKGQLQAAALPEPLLSLAVSQGATLLADDTQGDNLSQTILGFSDEYLAAPGGIETMTKLLEVWDLAVARVNEDPDRWRDTLVDQARLPEPLKETYAVSEYPTHQTPSQDQVDAVLGWMSDEGLLQEQVTYEDLILITP